jgi:hypothetical protein
MYVWKKRGGSLKGPFASPEHTFTHTRLITKSREGRSWKGEGVGFFWGGKGTLRRRIPPQNEATDFATLA